MKFPCTVSVAKSAKASCKAVCLPFSFNERKMPWTGTQQRKTRTCATGQPFSLLNRLQRLSDPETETKTILLSSNEILEHINHLFLRVDFTQISP